MSNHTKESIVCDSCEKELICDTGYPAVYALELRPIDVNRNTSHTQLTVWVKLPPTLHFCDRVCLDNYLKTPEQ